MSSISTLSCVLGGTGSLGSLISCWLAQECSSSLLLCGRSGRTAAGNSPTARALQRLFQDSVSTSLVRANTSCREEEAMHGGASPSGRVLVERLLHAGGILQDATVPNQTSWGLRMVAAPKLSTLSSAGVATACSPLEQMVLFSSIASLLGSPGQANYSATNAQLDAYAQLWQQQGSCGTSLQWGAWAGGGMATEATLARLERSGLCALQPLTGLAALADLMASLASHRQPVVCVNPFNWSNMLQSLTTVPDFLSNFKDAAPTTGASGRPAALGAPAKQSGGLSLENVREQVLAAVQGVLGAQVGDEEPLMAAGLDSLGAVELRNTLENSFGMQLPGTLVFDYPTTNAIHDFICSTFAEDEVIVGTEVPEAGPLSAGSVHEANVETAASWSGLSGLDSVRPVDAVGCVPYQRWDDPSAVAEGRHPQFGSFMAGVGMFDPTLFGITRTEAELMDPQHRLLLTLLALRTLITVHGLRLGIIPCRLIAQPPSH